MKKLVLLVVLFCQTCFVSAMDLGKIVLSKGPMCGGKSGASMTAYYKAEKAGQNPLFFQHAFVKTIKNGEISSRKFPDKKIPAISVLTAEEMQEELKKPERATVRWIGFDEAQFCGLDAGDKKPEAIEAFCKLFSGLKARGISVHIAALDEDFMEQPWSATDAFEKIAAPAVICREAKCHMCYAEGATKTMRYVDGKPVFTGETVKVGDVKKAESVIYYEPACATCYLTTKLVVAKK